MTDAPKASDLPRSGELNDTRVRVALASDHAGVQLKARLREWLESEGISVLDLGPSAGVSVDYPDFAERLGLAVVDGRAEQGVLICGSGIGVSIAANKVSGVRAARVSEPLSAALARQHNNANVVCLGARLMGEDMARACVETFLQTPFDPGDDGRHRRRVDLIDTVQARSGH